MTSRRTVLRAGIFVVMAVAARQSWMTFKPKGKSANMTSPDIGNDTGHDLTTANPEHAADPVQRSTPFAPVSVDLSYGISPQRIGEGEGAMLDPSGTSLTLITFEFHETHPAIREVTVGARINRLTLPLTATDVRVPQRNGPFFDELRRHVLWREGRVVKLSVNTGEEHALSLPFDVAELVAPALKTTGGPSEVLGLSNDRRHLALAQFFDAKEPVLAWNMDLPIPAVAMSCALGAAASGSERHIVFIGASSSGRLAIGTTHFGTGPASPFSVRTVDGLRPIPNTRPGIHVAADGRVTIGVLVQQVSGSLALFETRVTAGAVEGAEDKTYDVGTVASPPIGGAVLYATEAERNLPRRDAVLLLRDGTILRIGPDGGAVKASAQGRVFDHVNLVPGRQGPFILFVEPERGPRLEAF